MVAFSYIEVANGGVLSKIPKFRTKTPVLESLFNKVAGLGAILQKKRLTKMFSWKICKTCDNNYSKERLRTNASSITHVLQLTMFSSHFVVGLFNEVHYWIIRNQYVSLFGMRYSRIDQVKLSRPYDIKYFTGCLPQISLGPFLNTLSHLVPVLLTLTSLLSPIIYWDH